jgi:hypothetical protein
MNNSKPSWPSLTSRVELANGIGEDDSESSGLALSQAILPRVEIFNPEGRAVQEGSGHPYGSSFRHYTIIFHASASKESLTDEWEI